MFEGILEDIDPGLFQPMPEDELPYWETKKNAALLHKAVDYVSSLSNIDDSNDIWYIHIFHDIRKFSRIPSLIEITDIVSMYFPSDISDKVSQEIHKILNNN